MPFILYFVLRYQVIGFKTSFAGELLNNPFLQSTNEQKYATVLYTLVKYAQLLLFPVTLTHDYYPYHVPLYGFDQFLPWASLVLHLTLLVLVALNYKRHQWAALGLLMYLLPLLLVSNVLVNIGTFMNERFIYFSSVGFVMLAGIILHKLWHKNLIFRNLIHLFMVVVVLGFTYKTIDRNQAWKNDETLFLTDIETSVNSAKANTTAGGTLLNMAGRGENTEANLEKAIYYLRRSLSIHPNYREPKLLLGNAYWQKHNVDSVIYFYNSILRNQPGYQLVYDNVLFMVRETNDPGIKLSFLNLVYSYKPNRL
ncbi:MAG: hypothetical protein HC896_17535 [Bacteroidales bacterium]|nr:hypothetical protein [Bacteroidales bacterium]